MPNLGVTGVDHGRDDVSMVKSHPTGSGLGVSHWRLQTQGRAKTMVSCGDRGKMLGFTMFCHQQMVNE